MARVIKVGNEPVRVGGCSSVCAVAATLLSLTLATPAGAQEQVYVEFGSTMRYLANSTTNPPTIGMTWTAAGYDDGWWPSGTYGVGYENTSGAENLIQTIVPEPGTTRSVFTRVDFTVTDVTAVNSLVLGADFDDGYVAWLNGVEVFRSASMPVGALDWNTPSGQHESSNGATPLYELVDISSAGIPLLQNGNNELAVGVWNTGPGSSDLVLVPFLVANRVPAMARGPYLQSGTPDSVVVRWRTNVPTDSQVLYGTVQGTLDQSEIDPTSTTEHIVTLGGLDPDTQYYYAVGSSSEVLAGDDVDHFFLTSPPVGTTKPTRIWVLGDSGTADGNAAAVRDAYQTFTGETHTDLWLMLGDNAYNEGTDEQYQAAMFEMYPEMLRKSVLWPTLGNHDAIAANSPTESGPYYDIFTLPRDSGGMGFPSGTEAYYSFDYANIHFVVLDSHDTNRSPGGAMMNWLAMDVAETMQDWIIAFWHHPPYSKGGHNSDTELRLVEMRENAMPILEDHGVALTLSGHSHNYERSFLIDGVYDTPTPDFPTLLAFGKIVNTGDGRETGDGPYVKPLLGNAPHLGSVNVVAGSSGKLATVGTFDHPVMFTSFNVLGSLVLDVDGDRLDARFLDSTGTVLDQFTLTTWTDVSIGDRVWQDTDGNGIQDSGEAGIPGALVALYDGIGNPVSATFTDLNGDYSFAGLTWGDEYYARFIPPTGFSVAPQDQGGDDSVDSDVDPVTWKTRTLRLTELRDQARWDAGMVPECLGPDEPVYLSEVSLTSDGNEFPVLTFLDANQGGQVTGYNVYRSSDAAAPPASWPLIGADVADQDPATPNKQWVDDTGDVSPTGLWFYQVAAYNSNCSAEGPR
jgi:hypothetical protein